MALPDQAEELRRRVSELEAALSEAREQSRQMDALLSQKAEAERRKDDFIAVLGHELQNPLEAIQAGLELWASASPERIAWIHELLSRQAEQLARIVDDLLDISRISRGEVTLRTQTLELSEIVAGALASVNDVLSERGYVLEVCVPDGIYLEADPVRLEQILVNLLTSAARRTDEGGRIGLRADQEGDRIRIEVEDDGIGIAPEVLTSLFDMFAQAGAAENQGKGDLGIGLRLIRQLVEMHQGTIRAASEGPGKGSTFTVILPVGALDRTLSGALDSPGTLKTFHPRRILVVDDNQDLALGLSFVLEQSGHTVETAFDGAEALTVAPVFRPEVTVLDVLLPDLDGNTVAERLRSLEAEQGHRITIIGVSDFGKHRQEKLISGRRLFDYYLVRPVSLQLLHSLIETSPPGDTPVKYRAGKSKTRQERSRRVLIIDDSKTVADLSQQLLEAEGYETVVAYDGRRGVALAWEFKPDVVLCDLNLAGGLNGWEVASAIRERRIEPVPLLVALSAWGGDDIRHVVKTSTFDFHLSKPLDVRALERLISTSAMTSDKLTP
jgi:CheY-like chemotaxis protein/nitrogen-specific signal transduction histidine kinase